MNQDVWTEQEVFGDVCETSVIEADIWREVLCAETRQKTGYIKRERYKTIKEVFEELNAKLNVWECRECEQQFPFEGYCREDYDCPHCGKQDGLYMLIDEYFYVVPEKDEEWPHTCDGYNCRWQTIAYATTGSNEGHRYEVGVLVYGHDKTVYQHCFGGKTFLGMEHAQSMVQRIMRLMGM